jgi:MoxR-like ATPase
MNFNNSRFTPATRTKPGEGGYVYHDPRIVLAVNVALATRRPLLVTGVPGAGKSTLAADAAQHLQWAYVSTTITSRTQIEDLVARFDAVARLNDAQTKTVKDPGDYLIPGVLWWAFDPASAAEQSTAEDPRVNPENSGNGVVVLLDEIDKAEPDLPNDLLLPLDTYSITVPGRQRISSKTDALVIITSNGERTMPPAFLRRCLALELDDENPEFFTSVATSHFGPRTDTLYADVAERTIELGKQAEGDRRRRPSMAEYLDTVRACLTYRERPPNAASEGTRLWEAIEEAALRKTRAPRPGALS